MFKQYLTLKIISILYRVVLVISIFVVIYAIKIQNLGFGAATILIFVFSRIFFELMAVQFQQAETLTKILAVLEGKQERADEEDEIPTSAGGASSEGIK